MYPNTVKLTEVCAEIGKILTLNNWYP